MDTFGKDLKREIGVGHSGKRGFKNERDFKIQRGKDEIESELYDFRKSL